MSWRGAAPANEFELNPTRVNGGSEHEPHDFAAPVSSKSLEDSVKEMLRPLLRQWLDENMPRVLTAALREELENSDMQRRLTATRLRSYRRGGRGYATTSKDEPHASRRALWALLSMRSLPLTARKPKS